MRKIAGFCRHCGQEFVTRSGLKNHEASEICLQQRAETPAPEEPKPRFRRFRMVGNATMWERGNG